MQKKEVIKPKLVPKLDERSSTIPDVEWWDVLIMAPGSNYDDLDTADSGLSVIKSEAITNLIEHPIQMMPMVSTDPANTHVPVYLTKKELKKHMLQTHSSMALTKLENPGFGYLIRH